MCLFFGPCQLSLCAADASASRSAISQYVRLAPVREVMARLQPALARRGSSQQHGCVNTGAVTVASAIAAETPAPPGRAASPRPDVVPVPRRLEGRRDSA